MRSRSSKTRDVHFGDRAFGLGLVVPSVGLLVLLAALAVFLYRIAAPALQASGPGFLIHGVWDPVGERFGAWPFIYGTLVSALIAVAIATPISIGVALTLTELLPNRAARVVGFLVEMLAAIPSVVYGLWGIFVLAPWLRTTVEPALARWLGFLPFFQGTFYGVGMLAAGIILAIMIVPTISSISREVFKAVPRDHREAALALGATRWEMIRIAVLRSARAGVFGAVVLGLGRALGETMAVTMVIGNRADVSLSLFAPGQTMASVLANEYAEAASSAHLAALGAVGFVLFGVTFVVNALARLCVPRRKS